MSSIDKIKGIISRRGGLARPNRFMVDFTSLRYEVPTASADATVDLNFLVDNINIPGRAINTFEYSIWNHSIKIPAGYDEDDIEIVFNVTNDFLAKKIIDEWSAKVINQKTYLASYDNDFKKDINIWQLDDRDKKIYGVKILGAYPISSKGLLLDNSAESTVSRFSCTLTYNRFELAEIPQE